MVEDVRLSLEGQRPVDFYGRGGGNVPSVEELLAKIEEYARVEV
jgi:2-oxoglutarate/2-oxoacid ferredoxin oxidoreductase subunit alpha